MGRARGPGGGDKMGGGQGTSGFPRDGCCKVHASLATLKESSSLTMLP